MRLMRVDPSITKGWCAGPWDSALAISVGYATGTIDEPHAHTRVTEIYLVACGTAQARMGRRTNRLVAGDVLVVEPGEPHTFLSTSADYLHFVIQMPGLAGEETRTERVAVPRSDLGL